MEMGLKWTLLRKILALAVLLMVVINVHVADAGGRPTLGFGGEKVVGRGLKSVKEAMEVEDLSLEEQHSVMHFGQNFEAAKRHLLTSDPYSTKY